MKKGGARILIAILVAALAAACSRAVPIKEIIENPRNYAGKEVTIAGEVKDAFSLLAFKYFTVNDGTATMAVVSEKPLPKAGDKIRITGTIEEAFSLGTETLTILVEEPAKVSR